LVFHSSTIAMMHGSINIKYSKLCSTNRNAVRILMARNYTQSSLTNTNVTPCFPTCLPRRNP